MAWCVRTQFTANSAHCPELCAFWTILKFAMCFKLGLDVLVNLAPLENASVAFAEQVCLKVQRASPWTLPIDLCVNYPPLK